MSRVIKFRAWHKEDKKMYSVWGTLNDLVSLQTDDEAMLVVGFSLVELMQFTGLVDKNGHEVYEGDIVYSLSYKFNLAVQWCDGKRENLRNQVGWTLDDGRYSVEFAAHLEIDENDKEEYLNATIIGNIYENPELLKEKP